MVTQEGAPSLGGRPGSLDHVLRDARLSDLKAEFEQLAMDTGGAPQWIVNAHLPDQSPQARIELRSASEGAGFPPPISPEAGSVPAIAVDVRRFGHVINPDEVFGTHSCQPEATTDPAAFQITS